MKKKQSARKSLVTKRQRAKAIVDKPMRKAKPMARITLTLGKDIEAAAVELLRTLKNTRAWLERNKLHCPPVNLDHMDKAIAQAEDAGISVPSEARQVPG